MGFYETELLVNESKDMPRRGGLRAIIGVKFLSIFVRIDVPILVDFAKRNSQSLA